MTHIGRQIRRIHLASLLSALILCSIGEKGGAQGAQNAEGTQAGQEIVGPPHARVGDEIRFRAAPSGHVVVARVVALTRDSVSYAELCGDCLPITISRNGLSDLRMRQGREHTAKRTVLGSLTGAAVSTGIWVVFNVIVNAGCSGDGSHACSPGLILTPGIAAGGAVVGAVVGWFWTRERWVPATLASD